MTTIPLSQAIRLGAMLRPQAFGSVRDSYGGTCAFGAAYEAIGIHGSDATIPSHYWPWLEQDAPACPVCGEVTIAGAKMPSVIATHLNDTHLWTREQIADWVATIEAQSEQAAPVETPVAVAETV